MEPQVFLAVQLITVQSRAAEGTGMAVKEHGERGPQGQESVCRAVSGKHCAQKSNGRTKLPSVAGFVQGETSGSPFKTPQKYWWVGWQGAERPLPTGEEG